jgi:LysM repeat protein
MGDEVDSSSVEGASESAATDSLDEVRLPFTPSRPDGAPVDAASGTAWLPTREDRSPNPWVCPFLRAVSAEDDDSLGAPIEAPHPLNRCAAMHDAVPQSLRQQQLVCLTSGHVDCPRYLRGAVAMHEVSRPPVQSVRPVRPAILASILVLVAAFAGSVAFVVARGGIALDPAAIVSPHPSGTAVAEASLRPSPSAAAPSPTVAHAATASSAPSPSVSASPSATPGPSATPTPDAAPTTTPTPAATPTPKPPKAGSSDRYAVLDPCPDKPKCWIYTIRSGDNLYSIAHWFGVPIDTVYRLNPWARTTPLRAGQELILPPPTR